MAKHKKTYVEELLHFYDRVQDADGARYVEKYPGATQDWMDAMMNRSQSAIAWSLREMAAAFIQIAIAVLMGK